MTAEILPGSGQPVNQAEREVIFYLRGSLPNGYKILHNIEIKRSIEFFEIDLIILAPHGVYVVDIKGTHGQINVYGNQWHPEGRSPFYSPLPKLRQHAKIIKSLILDFYPARQDLGGIYVHAAVLMSNPDASIYDPDGRDEPDITFADQRCLEYFKDKSRLPQRARSIQSYFPLIIRALSGRTNPQASLPCFGNWQVEERLGETDRYIEYRAKHIENTDIGVTARLRVYQVDPYQDEADREAERKRIRTAFEAVYQLKHPHILPVQDFFTVESRDRHILVTDDFSGYALRQYLKRHNLTLTPEQKLSVIQEVLDALRYAHEQATIHRNLTPDTILISPRGQTCLTGFDYARLGNRNRTIAHEIIDDLQDSQPYQAPECHDNPAAASPVSDLFSAGLVFYELLTEKSAFQTGAQIRQTQAQLPASSQLSDLLPGVDQWLQKLCAFELNDRFLSADDALIAFAELRRSATIETEIIPKLDPANLQIGSEWDNQFIIEAPLGNPGSFCHAYKALDILAQKPRVLKIVTRDRHSVFQRLLQEYRILEELAPHPHIVKVRHARLSSDQVPYIVFEYVEGQDVGSLLNQNLVSLDQAIQIAQQTASGLVHLHKCPVFHQDIKPSNLLWTDDGVQIIDFNIAVSAQIESQIDQAQLAATYRYLPPSYDLNLEHSDEDKVDRDLYALGITFYECVTGHYPFDEQQSCSEKLPRHPHEFEGCQSLSNEIVKVLLKAISPSRAERFCSAEEFLEALLSIKQSTLDSSLSLFEPQSHRMKVSVAENRSVHRQQTIYDPLDTSPPAPPSFAADRFRRPSEKSVILDPTGLHEPLTGAMTIANEVEWMQTFFVKDGLYWVHGKTEKIAKQLCELTETWLQIHNQSDAIIETKQPPHSLIQSLLDPLPIPPEWSGYQLQNLAHWITSDSTETALPRLLAAVTAEDSIWLETPSINHLAAWLTIQVPPRYQVLEQAWLHKLAPQTSLASYYRTDNKTQLLRQWLGLAEPKLPELGAYPLAVPERLLPEFTKTWEEQIVLTDGQILDRLIPQQQPGMKQLATIAYSVMMKRQGLITRERTQKLSSYLSVQNLTSLEKSQQPLPPDPLQPDASGKAALTWVTDHYLPFRRWETSIAHQNTMSNVLAESFVEWLIQNYPIRRMDAEVMNTSVASLVQDLYQDSPVLWVVVDGLGWLDHQDLILYLTEQHGIAVETALQPRLSVLPTITKYAKWSLYSQLFPDHSSWSDDMRKGFSLLGSGNRYTDKEQKKLHRELKQNKYSLYCWDTTQLDKLYHEKQDWQDFHKVQRPRCLRQLAEDIEYCVNQHPQPEQLRIVIASDHGQMLGEVSPLPSYPNFKPEDRMGRAAIGKTDDPQFLVLERDRFGIPKDMSVVKGAAYIPSYSYKAGQESAISSHGGLFPEEVVIGVSVLRCTVERSAVLVVCKGEGNSRQSGELSLTINNLNSVPLTHLCLYINELPSLQSGFFLEATIAPESPPVSLNIPVAQFPELLQNHSGNQIRLSGKLTFRYAGGELGEAPLTAESALTIHQMFSSGFDIDEFL